MSGRLREANLLEGDTGLGMVRGRHRTISHDCVDGEGTTLGVVMDPKHPPTSGVGEYGEYVVGRDRPTQSVELLTSPAPPRDPPGSPKIAVHDRVADSQGPVALQW